MTGTYYAIGSLIADVLSSPPGTPPCDEGGSCGVPGLTAFAQTSDGSIANIEAIAAKRMDSGLAQSDVIDAAYRGLTPFVGRDLQGKIRAMANLYLETVHLVVHPHSGIERVTDLRGKRVAVDDEGSGTLAEARLMLDAFGLSENDFQPFYIKASPAVTLMKQGKLDAVFLVAGYPIAAATELVEELDCRILPIDGPAIDALLRRLPYLDFDLIPRGIYGDHPAVPTFGVGAQWIVAADLPESFAYELVRAFWNPKSQQRLRAGHPRGGDISLRTALHGIRIPLHPGAERYYREIGQ